MRSAERKKGREAVQALAPGVAGHASLLVGKRGDKAEPLRRDDLAIDKLAPHLLDLGGLQAVEEDAALAQDYGDSAFN